MNIKLKKLNFGLKGQIMYFLAKCHFIIEFAVVRRSETPFLTNGRIKLRFCTKLSVDSSIKRTKLKYFVKQLRGSFKSLVITKLHIYINIDFYIDIGNWMSNKLQALNCRGTLTQNIRIKSVNTVNHLKRINENLNFVCDKTKKF